MEKDWNLYDKRLEQIDAVLLSEVMMGAENLKNFISSLR